MKLWAYWLPDLLPHVPGCPVALARFELLRAAQAFFRESRSWQQDLPAFPVVAAQDEVTVAFNDPVELVRVERARYDGRKLGVTTPAALDSEFPSDDWHAHTGAPTHVYQLGPGVLHLYPVPVDAAATGLQLRVSVAPSDAAKGLPDEQAVARKDAIHMGAKARLMLYPKKAWSDPGLGAAYSTAFASMIDRAGLEIAKSFSDGRIRARPKWC